MDPLSSPPLAPRPARVLWLAAGWLCVGLGFIGAVLPVMPSTVFFVVAAHCFARGSDRWLRWLLGLPVVGPMVRDYRAGRGMPARAKVAAVSMLGLAALWSAWTLASPWGKLAVAMIAGVGAWYILVRVPTRR